MGKNLQIPLSFEKVCGEIARFEDYVFTCAILEKLQNLFSTCNETGLSTEC